MTPLLAIRDLRVSFDTADGVVHAVDGVSYELDAGATLAIVGESGSGKSVSSMSVLGLTRARNARISGRILFEGRDLATATDEQLRRVRGDDIAMIFQDPMSALHPYLKVGEQLAEGVRAHRDVSRRAARQRALEMLELVQIPAARSRAAGYPHELSGGMRQRVMIAMALVNDPRLLIADEPTSALDVMAQAQILELLASLRAQRGMAIVLITHDLGIVAELADDVAVMYAGRIVERAPAATLFAAPEHPYTWGLLQSVPALDGARRRDLPAIAGQPPSLVERPGGCSFHPRCPFVRDAHRHVVPELEAVAGDPRHLAACALPTATRRALWRALRAGSSPQDLRRAAEPPASEGPP